MTILEYVRRPWAIQRELAPVMGAYLRSAAALGIRGERPQAANDDQIQAAPQAAVRRQAPAGVAVISLSGIITPDPSLLDLLFGTGRGGLRGFRAALSAAVSDPNVEAIVLNVNSPGGVISLVPETAREIREVREQKKVVAVSNTIAFSAAYWLASQADEVVVTPSGEVGSIGVYLLHEDWSGWNERVGIDPTYVFAGEHKVEANPDEPLSEEAKAHLQSQVDEYHEMFLADVAAGRGVSVETVRNDFGRGRTFTARKAVDAGLADRVDTIEATVSRLAAGSGRQRSRALDANGDQQLLAQMNEQLRQSTQILKEDQQ